MDSEFRPRSPWIGPDLQTLRNTLRGPALPPLETAITRRLILSIEDGSGDRLSCLLALPPAEARLRDAPLVVLVHGLGGSEESNYVQVSARHFYALGYPVLQLSLRGAGPSRPLCQGQYHAGRSADFDAVVRALRKHPDTHTAVSLGGIVAIGYSLGGNMLLKYAAEFGDLRGVASVSAPIDLAAASRRILDSRNWIYHQYLLRRIKAEALDAPAGLNESERALIPKLRTILEFDDRFVAPHNGFRDAADYYTQCSAIHALPKIKIPALVIHAVDDPWIPIETYRAFPWKQNPHLEPLFARSGGHVGFHARDSRVPWHDQRLERFLSQL
ncbi:MAG: YheT family hydrolase [Myxococcota bacterium]